SGQKPGLHVDAAAHAALLAITHGVAGVYNIADDDGGVSIAKARAELGFDPRFRAPGIAGVAGGPLRKRVPPVGQGVTFFVNHSLILLRVCNTAKTLTSEWESGSAAPRFGHTRR